MKSSLFPQKKNRTLTTNVCIFEERLDPAVDISDENVAASPSSATRRARSNTVECQKENVVASLSPSPATRTGRSRDRCRSVLRTTENYTGDGDHQTPVAKRAKTNIQTSNKQSTLSWKTETDIDMVPQTLRFLPAREPGPQLSLKHCKFKTFSSSS
ncbi:hypothetical protein PO909_029619 [Leuciscus waleckii]